jgi:hypothetical protein
MNRIRNIGIIIPVLSGITLSGISDQDLRDLQIVGKIMGTKG